MDESAGIYAREEQFLDRYVQIGVAGKRVISVTFPEEVDDDASSDHQVLDTINSYFEGVTGDLASIPVGLTVPTPHRDVLETLRSVPYGEQVSVSQLAQMTPNLDPESTDDIQSVRTALDENPVPLLVPDHRVSDGGSALPPIVEQKFRSFEVIA